MIFQYTINQVLDGTKTQTRRLITPRDYQHPGGYEPKITAVCVEDMRGMNKHGVKWAVGKSYAVQPGRGKHSQGRIKITKIRKERIQDINPSDAWEEIGYLDNNPLHDAYLESGVANGDEVVDMITDEYACFIYKWIWNHIHTKPGTTWADNPLVWVLDFELVEEGK